MINKNAFIPIRKNHTNITYTGPKGIEPLPVTKHVDEEGFNTLNSVWVMPNILRRIMFVLHGEITLRISGNQHPPVCIIIGDIFSYPK